MLFLSAVGFVFVQSVFAQELGINEIGEEIALPTQDPRIVAARIIRVALGFLGIVAFAIVLYGGFVWMTAAGNEERIAKAKKVLTSAVIGLVIIIFAFSITQFVLNRLMEATGASPGGEVGPGIPPGGEPGLPVEAFVVRSISPSGSLPIRNVTVRVVFNRNVDLASLEAPGNFTVKKSADQSLVDGLISVSDNVAEFSPVALCPPPNDDKKCFEENTEYIVELTTEVRSSDGRALVCGGLAPSCQTSFTTGSLVDVRGPEVEITQPDSGQSVSADAVVEVGGRATDDAGISYLEFMVDGNRFATDSPTGSPREFSGKADWDTTGITLGSRHTLAVKAYDVDANSATSSGVEVVVRAAHCFNNLQDADETGRDCGGADCGACQGASCTSDFDCAGGHCENGVCTNLPVITSVQPDNGAPGNYITIFGQYFGSNPGKVVFLGGEGEGDDKVAPLASCRLPWQDNQIVVAVPEGAVSGPIKIEEGTTQNHYTDQTNDGRGPFLPDFNVNETVRPGLCSAEPASAPFKAEVTLTGINFGSERGDGEVTFGGTRAERIINWTNTSILSTVPNIVPGLVSLQVSKAGETSNPVNFQVTPVAEGPKILRFEPESGPPGEYVTIYGSNFGTAIGQVFFKDAEGRDILAATDFPALCRANWWKNDSVVVKVPTGAISGVLKLVTSVGLSDDTSDLSPSQFEITAGSPKPGLCLLEPDNGPENLQVNLYGERLGAAGLVKFWQDKTASTTTWNETQITAFVPSGAATGPVSVTVEGQKSNDLNFTVRDCRQVGCPAGQECCRDGTCAISPPEGPGCFALAGRGYYFWQFSTGEIPVYPQVVEECSGHPPDNPSPSPTPWDARGQTEVCVNAVISARFTTKIDLATLNLDNVQVYKCTGSEPIPCAALAPSSVSGSLTSLNLGPPTNQARVDFTPSGMFEPNSWYQITLKDGITSVNGFRLDGDRDGREGGDYVFKFKTRASSDLCKVGWLGVQPYQRTAEEEGELIAYKGDTLAVGDFCLLLDSSDYSWNWEVRDPASRGLLFATVEGGYTLDENGNKVSSTQDKAVAEAHLETGPTPVRVTGEIRAEGKFSYGELTIDFTDPKIVEKWPDCQEACINAAVGARFNTKMKATTLNTDNVKLYLWKCGNGILELGEDCDDGNALSGDGCSASCLNEGTQECTDPATQLNCCKNGRQEIGEDCDGVPFPTGCGASCLNVGTASPTCGNGQIDEGEDCDDGNTQSGDGCSNACLNEGTADLAPVSINPFYQEIDRRYELDFRPLDNLTPNAWYRAIISGNAESRSGVKLTGLNYDADKNGKIDSYSWAFKTKNDATACSVDHVEVRPESVRLTYVGAMQDYASAPFGMPDQCNPNGQELRAMDYNWAWSSEKTEVATVTNNNNYPKCGNSVREFGEDCDDGNVNSGDGCSNICLNEGSQLICGNRRLDIGEDCDDGNNRSGDGCNNRCLNEGSIAGGSVCGDFVREKGEDCDDGNTNSGDGCSNTCLNEGTVTDNFVDPFQEARTVGLDPQDVAAGQTESRTEIRARVQDKTGKSDLTMVCGYGPSKPCPDRPPDLGVGTDSCCYQKPKVETCDPSGATNVCSSGAQNVCRNAKITIKFDQEMDANSIAGNIIIAGNYSTCPQGATEIAKVSGGFARRTKWCVGGDVARITTSSRTIEEPAGSGEFKTVVDVYLTKLLDEGREYMIIVRGDNEGTEEVEGVKSKKGVALGQLNFDFNDGGRIYKSFAWTFTTSPDICILEKVVINPSFHLFTKPETYSFTAEAQDWRGRPISPISQVYDWSWAWASNIVDGSGEDIVSITNSDSQTQTATAQNRNGEEVISATATMITDEVLTPSTVGKTKTGYADVTVFICENPWPSIDEFYKDGGYKDSNYNFKTYFCRDRGEFGTSDDLPAFGTPVINDLTDRTKGDDLLREYFFFLKGKYCSLSLTPCDGAFGACPAGAGECRPTPDAIGIRIYGNADHSPLTEWAKKQGLVFASPESIEVDGYEAIRDGRTVYVLAANDTEARKEGGIKGGGGSKGGGSTLYTNVYLISYSDRANPDTVNIYNQLLNNLRFNINLTNSRLCKQGGNQVKLCAGDLNVVCTDDQDCQDKGPCNVLVNCSRDIDCPQATNVCDAPKDKLVRDVERILDLQKIAGLLESYKNRVGYYPKLEAGTYIRALTASVWGSWAGVLGNELGQALPTDPINKIVGCDEAGYDPVTCWNVDDGKYKCPQGSHIYQYKFNPTSGSYKLQSDFEYSGDRTLWKNDLSSKFEIENVCTGAVMQNEGVCGDGVINGTEQCEVGMTKYCSGTSPPRGCTTDADCDGGVSCVAREDDCTIRTCEKTDRAKFCSGNFGSGCTTDTDCAGAGSCVEEITVVGNCPTGLNEKSGSARDGRQAYDCDPGTCMWRTVGGCSVLCGDGVVQDGEECDQGPTGGRVPRGGTSSANQYACTSACAWTGGYCGDSTLQTAYGERCDDGTNNGTYGTKPDGTPYCKLDCSGFGPYCGDEIISGGSPPEQCDKNSQTSKGICYSGARPDDTLTASGLPCERDADCSAGTCSTTTAQSCRSDTDCPSGETCSGAELCAICANTGEGYPQFRTRTCSSGCSWNVWSACSPTGACGNGIKEGTEECDDGNTSNNDGCTTACKIARCGDGYVQAGVEACDAGTQNGVPCKARYGETCNYCSTECKVVTRTGDYCGDGEKNGPEVCDGRDGTELSCQVIDGVRYVTGTGIKVPTVMEGAPNTCPVPAQPSDIRVPLKWDRAMCNADCRSTCPPSYRTQTLTFGAEGRNSIQLASTSDTSVTDSEKITQITLPACRILGELRADVDLPELIPLNVVFVTDRSGSMEICVSGSYQGGYPPYKKTCADGGGESRMDKAKSALKNAIDQLFDSYENVKIGLVSFSDNALIDSDLVGPASKTTLESTINLYDASGRTATDLGLSAAVDILSAVSEEKNVIILMSDGEANKPGAASAAANSAKAAGNELYTIVFYGSQTAKDAMEIWSSGCALKSGRDSKSYDKDDYNCVSPPDHYYPAAATNLSEVYSAMIESIITGTITISGATTPGIQSGTQIPLEIGNIQCSSNNQNFDFSIQFGALPGEKARISNLRAYFCPGPPYPP